MWALAVDARQNVYAAGPAGDVLKVDAAGHITTLASGLAFPTGLAPTPLGEAVYVADTYDGPNHGPGSINKISQMDGSVAPLAITGVTLQFPVGVALDLRGNLYVANIPAAVYKVTPAGVGSKLADTPNPTCVAVDARGQFVYFGDSTDSVWVVAAE